MHAPGQRLGVCGARVAPRRRGLRNREEHVLEPARRSGRDPADVRHPGFERPQALSNLGVGAKERRDLLRRKDKTGKPPKATYRRSELSSQSAAVKDEVDPAFQNAQYWLLFPLHLSWDGGAKVEETGIHELPLGKGSATRVVVTYPPEGGYTPGDVLKLFVGA